MKQDKTIKLMDAVYKLLEGTWSHKYLIRDLKGAQAKIIGQLAADSQNPDGNGTIFKRGDVVKIVDIPKSSGGTRHDDFVVEFKGKKYSVSVGGLLMKSIILDK